LPTVANTAATVGAMQNDQIYATDLAGTTDAEQPDGTPPNLRGKRVET